MKGWPIGTWTCPSGNQVEVKLTRVHDGHIVWVGWDHYPPSKRDRRYYEETVAPVMVAKVVERLKSKRRGVFDVSRN